MSEDTKPYPSWKLDDASNQWIAPVSKPILSNVAIRWDEAHRNWKCSKKVYPSWVLKDFGTHGETIWAAPVNRPIFQEGVVELWDEETQTWQHRNSLI